MFSDAYNNVDRFVVVTFSGKLVFDTIIFYALVMVRNGKQYYYYFLRLQSSDMG